MALPSVRSSNGKRISRFCFTLNNWTDEEYESITGSFAPSVKWIIVAKETGENGTPHLQGACVIGKQMAFSTLKKLTGFSRAHLEPMCGTPHDSLVYCSKQDTQPFQMGTLPKPGKRNDIHEVAQRILGGENISAIVSDVDHAVVFVKYSRGLMNLSSITSVHRMQPPLVFWLHGSTGVGKTRIAFEAGLELSGGPDDIWVSSGGLKWFDGYHGQTVAIFDDFRAKHVANFAYLLRLLDRYPVTVEIKGGTVKWTPKIIFITCPTDPDECFRKRKEHVPEDIAQLHRRISEVFCISCTYDDHSRYRLISRIRRICERHQRLCGSTSGSSGESSDSV